MERFRARLRLLWALEAFSLHWGVLGGGEGGWERAVVYNRLLFFFFYLACNIAKGDLVRPRSKGKKKLSIRLYFCSFFL